MKCNFPQDNRDCQLQATEKVLQLLQQQVEALSHTIDSIEMHGRRQILLLNGFEETKDENIADIAVEIITKHLNHRDLILMISSAVHDWVGPLPPKNLDPSSSSLLT
ncbi:unnamed protein product [Arctia plantaginis]|uniref:Uncharacterized protein n=1 Tax=Arctia plantaginis TaxID=874455 RepID=A0A8S0Z911_ARCPL|nr:unnamed protein product [Arctia plantaginis]